MGNKPVTGVADATSDDEAVNLGQVNTSLALKADLASPTFTGDPKAPTPSGGDNDTSIATTAFVQGELASYAPLASPALTGNPTAPTQSADDNSTKIATTAYADAAANAGGFQVSRLTSSPTTTSGTWADVSSQMNVTVSANTNYVIIWDIFYNSPASADSLSFGVNVPSGASFRASSTSAHIDGSNVNYQRTTVDTGIHVSDTTTGHCRITGGFAIAGTGGTVALRFATAGGGGTGTCYSNSFVMYKEL